MLFALVRFNRRRLDGTYGPYIEIGLRCSLTRRAPNEALDEPFPSRLRSLTFSVVIRGTPARFHRPATAARTRVVSRPRRAFVLT